MPLKSFKLFAPRSLGKKMSSTRAQPTGLARKETQKSVPSAEECTSPTYRAWNYNKINTRNTYESFTNISETTMM